MRAVTTVIGCLALVAMIATITRVFMIKLGESVTIDPHYVRSVYEQDLEERWSGTTHSQQALLPAKEEPALPDSAAAPLLEKPPITSAVSVGGSLQPSVAQTNAATAAPETPTSVQSGIQNIEFKRLKIEGAVRGFFEASDIAGKLAFARDPQRVRSLMENYYRSHAMERVEWKSLGWTLPVEEPGHRLCYALAVFKNADPVSLIVEETADGIFRVDWESSVRYGELDWDEFIETKPASPTLLRVIASKSPSVPSEHTAQNTDFLEVRHPARDGVILAHFDRNNPKLQSLLQQLQAGNWKDVPLTLRLCYPGSAGSGKSVQIADIEGKGWLILQTTKS